VEKSPGEIFHKEFLEISGSDPRKAFLEGLLEVLGNEGPIIVYGTFERSITLPDMADDEKITADLKDGVLVVTIGKKASVKPRQIEVKMK
jgi:hypothetical protein